MPYILLKQSTLAPGVLQNLDLRPNTSQRVFPYQTYGQTGYRHAVPNDLSTLTAGLADQTARGLTAWFLSQVNDGTGAASAGTFTCVSAIATDSVTITTAPVFTLVALSGARTSGGMDFDISGGDNATAADLADAINDDANWATIGVTRPVSAVAALNVVTVTALSDGTAGDYVLAQTGGTIAVVGMTGGVDADALPNSDASDNADDVLGLLGYDVVTAAATMDLAAINGALTAGAITAAQVSEVLDILAGRNFVLEAGASVAPGGVWAIDGGAFDDEEAGFRRIYDSGALRISFGEARLSLIVADDWSAEGAAVAVYNDDGTLYTV
ncbi:hypothetical protein N9917_00690 [Deltaproteobacteria bacterium]|nr:hypothetical protein [Deltaproteobacteria bacterium]